MRSDSAFVSNFIGLRNKSCSYSSSSLVLCCATGSESPVISRRAVLKVASSVAAASLFVAFPRTSSAGVAGGVSSVYDVEVLKDKKLTSLSFLRKKVTLFVNVASYCAVSSCCSALYVNALDRRAWHTC